MDEDKKERDEMLADENSPIWKTKLGDVTLEQIYQATRHQAMRSGIPLSRAGFLATRGIVMMTPKSMVQLAELGVEVVGYQAMVISPLTASAGGKIVTGG